ncbi:alpha/beta hydrolase [Halosolutus amylolyticus]|uniref:Alpha/beta hydrolase n=1 Tax=Halosolutus amylolyticus TaxID=2932267 RepID=A0ABD5PU49_9EURY|nr:dienelactone hydrolase family protein [Halosolutus amylolyticus]
MTDVLVPGGRDVRGILDEPADAPNAIVVACPPHPQHGGSRSDRRLTAVSETLTAAGIACLRFDYGPWEEGVGEREDVRNAIRWAGERADRVGVFGFSFGAAQSLLATADVEVAVSAVSVLAPPARLGPDLDAVAAYDRLDCPVQVCYGERDTTVDSEPIVDLARERDDEVVTFSADHFFVGQHDAIASEVGSFFERTVAGGA